MESLPGRENRGRFSAAFEGAFSLPALISAVLCVGLLRTQILSFFFLVPLGFAAYGYSRKTAWVAAVAAVLGNCLFSLNIFFLFRGSGAEFVWDMSFFSLVTLIFTWIVAPPGEGRFLKIPGAYRLLAGSALGFFSFLLLVNTAGSKAGFYTLLQSQAEAVSSLYIAASPSVVERSLMEQYLTPEAILETFRVVALRGGGLLACIIIFFTNYQLSRTLVRLFRHRDGGRGFIQFHTGVRLVWILSCSLLLVLFFRLMKTAPWLASLEIILWNILILCITLYLAQGWGIVAFFMARTVIPPFLRLLSIALLVFLLLKPGINAFVLGLLVLLGIAENWVPFRAPKTNGPPSTPGA